jgi:Rib/alpha/Esp surface antigen-like repeat protein
MSLTFVTGNTKPYLTAVIHDEDDPSEPINLTGCSVRLQMRKADDRRFTVNAEVDITSAAAGAVEYRWGTNDLNQPGTYEVQFEVTFPDSKVQTTAVPVEIEVRRA